MRAVRLVLFSLSLPQNLNFLDRKCYWSAFMVWFWLLGIVACFLSGKNSVFSQLCVPGPGLAVLFSGSLLLVGVRFGFLVWLFLVISIFCPIGLTSIILLILCFRATLLLQFLFGTKILRLNRSRFTLKSIKLSFGYNSSSNVFSIESCGLLVVFLEPKLDMSGYLIAFVYWVPSL